jgi:Protein of unknown function (DUF3631)
MGGVSNLKDRDLRRFEALHKKLFSSLEHERIKAKVAIDKWLAKHGLTPNDVPEIFACIQQLKPASSQPDPRNTDPHPFDAPDTPSPADVVRELIEKYMGMDPHDSVTATLWALHCYVFDRFMVTPRLFVMSAIEEGGKSNLMDIINRLVAGSKKYESITTAALIRRLDATKAAVLLDEVDNLRLEAKEEMRTVLNAGYRRGGTASRTIDGKERAFDVHAPVAMAGNRGLPSPRLAPLRRRLITIRLKRYAGTRPLKEFDSYNAEDMEQFDTAKRYLVHWAQQVTLNRHPEIPLRPGSRADNWRPLISVGDANGPKWAALAREAAIALSRRDREENVLVTLLRHVEEIFNTLGVDRLLGRDAVRELLNLESADGMWTEFCGVNGGEWPRKLTQTRLAGLLKIFEIHPRVIWPYTASQAIKAGEVTTALTSRVIGRPTAVRTSQCHKDRICGWWHQSCRQSAESWCAHPLCKCHGRARCDIGPILDPRLVRIVNLLIFLALPRGLEPLFSP